MNENKKLIRVAGKIPETEYFFVRNSYRIEVEEDFSYYDAVIIERIFNGWLICKSEIPGRTFQSALIKGYDRLTIESQRRSRGVITKEFLNRFLVSVEKEPSANWNFPPIDIKTICDIMEKKKSLESKEVSHG